jgi:hypothetical protein
VKFMWGIFACNGLSILFKRFAMGESEKCSLCKCKGKAHTPAYVYPPRIRGLVSSAPQGSRGAVIFFDKSEVRLPQKKKK